MSITSHTLFNGYLRWGEELGTSVTINTAAFTRRHDWKFSSELLCVTWAITLPQLLCCNLQSPSVNWKLINSQLEWYAKTVSHTLNSRKGLTKKILRKGFCFLTCLILELLQSFMKEQDLKCLACFTGRHVFFKCLLGFHDRNVV